MVAGGNHGWNPKEGTLSHGQHLRAIREFHITPSNAPNLAILGFGEDARGEIYVLGNVSGLPFGAGVILRLAPAANDDVVNPQPM